MKREEIIKMARKADQYASAQHVQLIGPEAINTDWVVAGDERFAALVAAAEREECAKVCDQAVNELILSECDKDLIELAIGLRDAIRARRKA